MIFRARKPPNGLPYLIGGIGFCAVAVLGFFAALVGHVQQPTLTLMTTTPGMIGGIAIVAGWRMMRAPLEVRVGRPGMLLVFRKKSERLPWGEMAFAMAERDLMRQRRMKIYNPRGRLVASLTDSLEDFDDLIELVDARLAARPDPAKNKVGLRKARRMAVINGVCGALILCGSVALAWHTREEARSAKLLRDAGVETDGEIVERFLAPNGVTPRLVYRVTNPQGNSATRNAEMERIVWDELANEKKVRVVYVPDEPSISRVLEGEVQERQQNEVGYLGCAFGAAMGLFFLAFAGLLACGYSIDVDSKTGKVSIKQYGTGR
jgi:hypothetical protein